MQLQPLEVDLIDLRNVFPVILAKDDIRDTCSFRREQFFFHAADRKHLPAQRHLAGHRDSWFH